MTLVIPEYYYREYEIKSQKFAVHMLSLLKVVRTGRRPPERRHGNYRATFLHSRLGRWCRRLSLHLAVQCSKVMVM